MLDISTNESIYKPIEIKVEGKLYSKKIITYEEIKEWQKWDEKKIAKDSNGIYKQINEIMNIPIDILKKIDIRELKDIQEYILDNISNSTKREKKNPSIA